MKSESGETIALKAAPALGYLGATLGGLSLPDWAALLACVYTLCLLGQMALRWVTWFRNGRRQYGRRLTDHTPDEHEDAGV